MATTKDSSSHSAGKPAPIPCTVLTGEPLNGLLAVDSEGARVALDLQVVGGRSVYLILEQDTAIDLALRPKFGVPGASAAGAPDRLVSGTPNTASPNDS